MPINSAPPIFACACVCVCVCVCVYWGASSSPCTHILNSNIHAHVCTQVVAGDYAFVLHTTNPVSKDKDEMMGELCVGLGSLSCVCVCVRARDAHE